MSTARSIAFWTTTAVIVFILASGGVADLMHAPSTEAGMTELGYPTYVMTILGFWKILGAMAILAPRFPLVKEWAYAGAFFDLTGGFVSHIAHGSAANHLFYTGFFAGCVVASWALRPASRTLGAPVFRRYGQVAPVAKTPQAPAAV
ncbi:DoxX family protein [Nocardia sp. NBC_00508]|uniref:DoxX family protein n=1 Tax=Nocardia sp. NBC_00508 TaxID=2975992 RepID=UPI002E803AEB|nr:DoxX family protein [Nocardia sp. NBC_00508]WUD67751.1 DoxX family protein [Nocardia sp. NBC_00508]